MSPIATDAKRDEAEVREKIRWRPWCPEAFAEARGEDKLLLLDIGAGWCHWCHVMDRTTYLDDEVADFVNQKFVPVRVDRDERPEVDRHYQSAPTLVESSGGGWPLTVFLLPGGEPLYRATYLPPRSQGGFPGFLDLARQVLGLYADRRADIARAARELQGRLAIAQTPDLKGALQPAALAALFADLDRRFDEAWGGFDAAVGTPKFPAPGAFEFLLAHARRTGHGRAAQIAGTTLLRMAEGGVHDQLAGGFHRYSVDPYWRVPHFEKLLYDNAELLSACLHAWQWLGASGDGGFDPARRESGDRAELRRAAEGILRFADEILADHERGGFRGSQDADVGLDDDGNYFTWSLDEVGRVLHGPEFEVFTARYDVEEVGEMSEDRARNVLWQAMSLERLARRMNLPVGEVSRLLAEAERKVLAARLRRPAPRVDATLYASWNGMMIRAAAEAARVFDRPDVLDLARRAADRLLEPVADGGARLADGSFVHVAGQDHPSGLLEDQAWMAFALAELFEATGEAAYLDAARAATGWADEHLWDTAQGGYFERLADPDDLGLGRVLDKPIIDSPSSSGNAVMALALLKLAALDETGAAASPQARPAGAHEDYVTRARQVVETFAEAIPGLGVHGGAMALAAEILLAGTTTITVVGSDEAAAALERAAHAVYVAGKAVIALDPSRRADRTRIEQRGLKPGAAGVAYVCRGTQCLPPATTPEKLAELLKQH